MRVIVSAGVGLLAGCGAVQPPCDGGPAPLAFTDVSDAWGLRELGVVGNRFSITDLEGDGRPDLVVSTLGDGVRDPDGTRRFLLRNAGGRFEDVTASSGFADTRDGASGRPWNFVLWGDLDADGDLDGVSVHARYTGDDVTPPLDGSEILLNDGGQFTLAASGDLSMWRRWTTAGSLLDADRDGRLDLFLGNQYGVFGALESAEQDLLFRGDGMGGLDEATDAFGLTTGSGGGRHPDNARNYVAEAGGRVRWPTFGTLACDLDGDGDDELFTQTYGRGLNQLWRNDDGRFVNVTEGSGVDRDADLGGDDYAADERFRCWCAGGGAATLECAGVPAPRIGCTGNDWLPGWDDQAHRLGGNTFSAACADFDGDGDLDLATGEIRHWWTPGASDRSNILWNDGNLRFRRDPPEAIGLAMTFAESDWNEGDLTVAAADLDLDGDPDLVRPQSDYAGTFLRLFRNDGGRFVDASRDAGIAFPRAAGVALADLDGDGDQDVITSFSRMRCDDDCPYATPEVHVFRNDNGQQGHGLVVRLVGADGSVSPLGATVRVTVDGRTQVQELQAGEGHQGVQHELALTFGLGARCVAEQVEVRWPDGSEDAWSDVAGDATIRLAPGADPEVTPRG